MVTIEELMRIAKDNGASDVHITVGIPPKMRVAGALTDMDFPRFLPNDTSEIIKSIMNERQLEILNKKGEVDFSFSIPSLGRYRINVYNQRGSLAAAIRLVGTTVPKPEELGLPKSVVDLYSKKRGLVLVTGPTGSGKSTTLASLVDKINENISSHIITLEDPIEYLHHHKKAMVNQREIGIDSMTYANALRAALREDPDVILVGEMRDLETISIAITAAELAMVLEAVISQQLLPTVDKSRRVGAFEVMLMTTAIKNLIRENKVFQIDSMIQTSKKLGMITMDDAILDLLIKGEISTETALSFAQDRTTFERKINII